MQLWHIVRTGVARGEGVESKVRLPTLWCLLWSGACLRRCACCAALCRRCDWGLRTFLPSLCVWGLGTQQHN